MHIKPYWWLAIICRQHLIRLYRVFLSIAFVEEPDFKLQRAAESMPVALSRIV
jgi:hypothetical protein